MRKGALENVGGVALYALRVGDVLAIRADLVGGFLAGFAGVPFRNFLRIGLFVTLLQSGQFAVPRSLRFVLFELRSKGGLLLAGKVATL